MDDGIFKTKRTGLVGGRRVDIQWLWEINRRAKRLEKACRVERTARLAERTERASGQLPLPGLKRG